MGDAPTGLLGRLQVTGPGEWPPWDSGPGVGQPTCQVAELRNEHGGAGQCAPGTSPPLGLADQDRLLQVGDLLVILLLGTGRGEVFTDTRSRSPGTEV